MIFKQSRCNFQDYWYGEWILLKELVCTHNIQLRGLAIKGGRYHKERLATMVSSASPAKFYKVLNGYLLSLIECDRSTVLSRRWWSRHPHKKMIILNVKILQSTSYSSETATPTRKTQLVCVSIKTFGFLRNYFLSSSRHINIKKI